MSLAERPSAEAPRAAMKRLPTRLRTKAAKMVHGPRCWGIVRWWDRMGVPFVGSEARSFPAATGGDHERAATQAPGSGTISPLAPLPGKRKPPSQPDKKMEKPGGLPDRGLGTVFPSLALRTQKPQGN